MTIERTCGDLLRDRVLARKHALQRLDAEKAGHRAWLSQMPEHAAIIVLRRGTRDALAEIDADMRTTLDGPSTDARIAGLAQERLDKTDALAAAEIDYAAWLTEQPGHTDYQEAADRLRARIAQLDNSIDEALALGEQGEFPGVADAVDGAGPQP